MTIPETDVGKLLALYKQHDELMHDMLELIGKNSEMISQVMKMNDRNMNFIDRQGNLILFLFDEIKRLNERIDKLEKVV